MKNQNKWSLSVLLLLATICFSSSSYAGTTCELNKKLETEEGITDSGHIIAINGYELNCTDDGLYATIAHLMENKGEDLYSFQEKATVLMGFPIPAGPWKVYVSTGDEAVFKNTMFDLHFRQISEDERATTFYRRQ